MNGTTEIECGKCGTYIYVEVVDGKFYMGNEGCHHIRTKEELEYYREEILEGWGSPLVLDESQYRGPSNEPGLTSREYREMREEEDWAEWDRIERMNDLIWEMGR